MQKLQCAVGLDLRCCCRRALDNSIDQLGKSPYAQDLDAEPELKGVKTPGGQQRIRDQVGYAFHFVHFGVQVIGCDANMPKVAAVGQQESSTTDRLEEGLVEIHCD